MLNPGRLGSLIILQGRHLSHGGNDIHNHNNYRILGGPDSGPQGLRPTSRKTSPNNKVELISSTILLLCANAETYSHIFINTLVSVNETTSHDNYHTIVGHIAPFVDKNL